jgi:hypothetical protein
LSDEIFEFTLVIDNSQNFEINTSSSFEYPFPIETHLDVEEEI